MKTKLKVVGLWVLSLLLLSGVVAMWPVQAAPSAEEPPGWQDLVDKAENEGAVRVIVGLDVPFKPEGDLDSPQDVENQQLAISSIQQSVLQKMAGSNMSLMANFKYIPYMAVAVDAAALAKLAALPETTTFEEDIAVPPTMASSLPVIGAPDAWAAGFDGTGQAVAVLDTGVDKTHSFFSTGGNKVVSEACYSNAGGLGGETSVCPGGVSESTAVGSGIDCTAAAAGYPIAIGNCEHGTHVAGTVAGNDGTGPNYGVARGGDIIAIQVFTLFKMSANCFPFTNCALTYTSDQIKGLERVYALRNTYNIAAANMSLGGGQYFAHCDAAQSSRKAAIDNLRSAGIATVIASGNNGFKDSMSAPACISTAVSVGATDDADNVASFSNIASFINLLAPGVSIDSSVPGGGIGNKGGTSMATPHVAGAWAVMKQKSPDATVSEILLALSNTGTLVDDNRSGGTVTDMPRINVNQALLAIDTTPPKVSKVNSNADTGDGSLDEGENTNVAITQLLFTFDEAVQDPPGDTDADDVTNPNNYRLFNDGTDGTFQTSVCGAAQGDDQAITINSVTYNSGTREATLNVNGGTKLPDDSYRLLACGSISIKDLAGNSLDGNGDGTGGDDFTRNFSVKETVSLYLPIILKNS